VLNGLCVFTVAFMLVTLNGPWDVFKLLREKAGIQHDADGNHIVVANKFFAKLLDCVWCTGTWVSAGVSLFTIMIMGEKWYLWFYVWLASIAIAGLWNRMVMHEG